MKFESAVARSDSYLSTRGRPREGRKSGTRGGKLWIRTVRVRSRVAAAAGARTAGVCGVWLVSSFGLPPGKFAAREGA